MSRRSNKKHVRRRARENAVALIYSSDINEMDAMEIVEEGLYPAGDINLSEYAEKLVEGVCAHREEIDGYLTSTSENWALDRMPFVDRAILRVAIYEMLYVDEVPVSVAINEAVEIAKTFGGEDDSSRFVNGVLGKIARAKGEDADAADLADAPADEGAQAEEQGGDEGAQAEERGDGEADASAADASEADVSPADATEAGASAADASEADLPAASAAPATDAEEPGEDEAAAQSPAEAVSADE